MSCMVMRIWSPERRSDPSSTCVAPSCRAISRTSVFVPLKANAEVRATTRRVGMCASQLDSSSVRPSHSACSFWSTLMSTSGSTTIVGSFSGVRFALEQLAGHAPGDHREHHRHEDAAEAPGQAFQGCPAVGRAAPDDGARFEGSGHVLRRQRRQAGTRDRGSSVPMKR